MAADNSVEAIIPINERLIEGAFINIAELCALKGVSKSVVYVDMKAGRLPYSKFGTATRIAGLDAKNYIPYTGIVKPVEAA